MDCSCVWEERFLLLVVIVVVAVMRERRAVTLPVETAYVDLNAARGRRWRGMAI